MSRPLADPLYERLLDAFPATRPYTQADWDDDAMPGPVAHFLGQLLRHYSRREARRLRRARSKWVDYDHPAMEDAVRSFFEAVEAHTRVPADEWKDTLRQATHHAAAHLVRPVHELTDFVYARQEGELRLPEILWRMNFFGPYAYLREAVNAFATKRDLEALGPERFERFLGSIDERITADYGADRWLRLLDPLFATARRATGREEVPVSLLRSFFAEKGRDDIDRRLQAHAEEGHRGVTPRALHRLIEDATAGTPPDASAAGPAASTDDAPAAEGPTGFTPPAPDAAADDDIWGVAGAARPEGNDEPQPSTDEDGDVPLWKRFQQGRTGNSSSTADEPGAEATADDGAQEPLWARFRHERDERLSDAVSDATSGGTAQSDEASGGGGASPSSPSTSPSITQDEDLEALERDVLGGVTPSHRAVYIRQLFGGDETNYRQVLRRLARADSWGEASQLIASDIFRAYKVNIYSDAAVHFTNAVEARFRE
jgi:hypothetical protein